MYVAIVIPSYVPMESIRPEQPTLLYKRVRALYVESFMEGYHVSGSTLLIMENSQSDVPSEMVGNHVGVINATCQRMHGHYIVTVMHLPDNDSMDSAWITNISGLFSASSLFVRACRIVCCHISCIVLYLSRLTTLLASVPYLCTMCDSLCILPAICYEFILFIMPVLSICRYNRAIASNGNRYLELFLIGLPFGK